LPDWPEFRYELDGLAESGMLARGDHSVLILDFVSRVSMLAESRRKGHAGRMFQSEMEIPRRHRSACADAVLRAELERIVRMTIEERVKAALSMRERFAWLNPTTKTP